MERDCDPSSGFYFRMTVSVVSVTYAFRAILPEPPFQQRPRCSVEVGRRSGALSGRQGNSVTVSPNGRSNSQVKASWHVCNSHTSPPSPDLFKRMCAVNVPVHIAVGAFSCCGSEVTTENGIAISIARTDVLVFPIDSYRSNLFK